jgi:hypothetical protein
LLTVVCGLTLVGVFGPWLRSGSSTRSSFELLDLAERLGFASSGLFVWVVRPWPFVPVVVVAAAIAGWAARPVFAATAGVAVSLYVGAVALAVINAPDAGLIDVEWGAGVSLVGGILLLGTACWVGVARRSP